MALWTAAKYLAFFALISGVHSEISLTQNHEEVTAKEGDEIELLCTAPTDAVACSFRSPKDKTYVMFPGASYEADKIVQNKLTEKDCSIRITRIEEIDNGEWECSITAKAPNGDLDVGTGKVQVIVAVPPQEVHLQVEGQRVAGPIEMNLDEEQQIFVDCVANGARPAPEFTWYIADTKLNANVQQREEVTEDGSTNYISTLEYNAASKHSGQMLKCEVNHMGYTMQAINDESNIAQAELNIQFKPELDQPAPQTFYGMKEDEENSVQIKFKANPKPNMGQWRIGEVSVPIGAADVDNKFQSSQIMNADLSGEYQVKLTFTMTPAIAGKNYALEVTNDLGTTTYEFNLALSEKPPAESANGPVIGIIILVVIIILVGGITVIARAKGALCFAAKSGEPLEEEKEAFDDAEKGKLAPSGGGEPVKSTPDKKPEAETKPETEDNKEDKKSNGAHTPV